MVGILQFFIPFGITIGGIIIWYAIMSALVERATPRTKNIAIAFEQAEIKMPLLNLTTILISVGLVLWLLASILFKFSIITEIFMLVPFVGIPFYVLRFFVNYKVKARKNKFLDQLEMALRLMSGGIKVGLSLPQAIAQITEEMGEPARSEFVRIVRMTRMGTSTTDALNELATRMPGSETMMLARVVGVQSQTGGSLSTILDHLAETIKERRMIQRKIASLTAEGRMGAIVLEGLPVMVGGFVLIFQKSMSTALMGTLIGHVVLGVVVFLEFMAIFVLNKMLEVKV